MRKTLIVAITVVSFAFLTSQALAWWCDGNWGGGPWTGGYYSNAPSGSYQSFLNDTAALRADLAAKETEYNALMAQPNPDPQKANNLSLAIAGLRNQIQAKAQNYGMMAPGAGGYGHGSYGSPMSSYGYGGYCW